MLCLRRKKYESIVIHQNGKVIAVIRVLEIASQNAVRIGIEAPDQIAIHRQEIFNEMYPDLNGTEDEPA